MDLKPHCHNKALAVWHVRMIRSYAYPIKFYYVQSTVQGHSVWRKCTLSQKNWAAFIFTVTSANVGDFFKILSMLESERNG